MDFKKIFQLFIQLGLVTTFSSPAVCATKLPRETPGVMISVFNHSDISSELLKHAEKVSSRVFEEAGIRIDWVDCFPAKQTSGGELACQQAALPQHLQLVIMRHSLGLKDSILGISYGSTDGSGGQADVFYEGIEKLQRETLLDPAILLGHVAAHEIGHLLLGINSHSPWGIMRAHWQMEDLALANRRMLLFTKSQSNQMTVNLCVAMSRAQWPSVSSTELSAHD